MGLAALVVVLVASTAAFAATQRASAGTRSPATVGLGGACGALMGDPAVFEDMQALRAEHQADMRAWRARYGSDPNSTAAQAALAKLRTEHMNDMRALRRKHDAKTGTWSRGGMMGGAGSGSSGMMGGY